MRAAIVITLLVAATSLQAQASGWPNKRQGFWVGFGVGDGSARIDCTYFCGSSRTDAASGYLRLGGTLSSHVRLGGEVNLWMPPGDLTSDVIEVGTFVALWYPRRTSAFYVKLGVGAMRYRANARVADITSLSANAPSATLGFGYEVRIQRGISLVPSIDVLTSSRVRLDYSLGFSEPPPAPPDVRINLVQAGLGVSWQR
jgi:hypothetical protein